MWACGGEGRGREADWTWKTAQVSALGAVGKQAYRHESEALPSPPPAPPRTLNSSEKSALTAWSNRLPQSPRPLRSRLRVRHGFISMAWHQLATWGGGARDG